MSTVAINSTTTPAYFSGGHTSDAERLPPPVSPQPQSSTENPPATTLPRQLGGQLTQARLDEPSTRHRREAVPVQAQQQSPDPAALAQMEKADTQLQSTLQSWLISGLLRRSLIPEHSSVKPFVDNFVTAALEPKVQSWFKSKGLELSTVCVSADWVEGTVVVDGKPVTRKFTATDGSGWDQVGVFVTAAARQLRPDNYGVLLPDSHGKFRHVDALLNFYGVKLPSDPKEGKALGMRLKKHGWPALPQAQREQWAMQLLQHKQDRADSAMRVRLSEQMQPLLKVKGHDDSLGLEEMPVVAEPGSSLERRSQKPRERFNQFLTSPPFQAFLEKTGYKTPGREFRPDQYRLSEGDLQMRNSAGHWISLMPGFDDEVWKVSYVGSTPEQAAVRKMDMELKGLVKESEKTGNALYAAQTYDARQAMAFYALDAPKTVEQLRATLGWPNMKLPQAPVAGNYAGMTSYGDTLGELSAVAKQVLKGASNEVMELLKDFSDDTSGFQSFPDTDSALAAFFDASPLVDIAERIASALKLYAVADGQPLPRAERIQLLATVLKLSVDAPVPGLPGTVAGYDLYQTANLGRTLKEVRSDVEKQLESKGVDSKVSALMAHLFLAQSAPEMLIKKDPAVSADTAKVLSQDPDIIKVGSAGWIYMRLASAISGDRRLNLTQAMAVARQETTGPNQAKLHTDMGAQAVLDWGAMAGIYPASPNRKYSREQYAAAAQAFSQRQKQINQAFKVLATESPTQTSLLVKQLALLFPEMSEDEIRNLKLLNYPDQHQPRYVGVRQAPSKSSPKLLTDVILLNQFAGDPPLGKKDAWTKGTVIHPKISLETFRERLKALPAIEPLVIPAIDSHIDATESAQATALKLAISQLPLEDRRAVESGKVEFFTLREETAEEVLEESGANSKVASKRGTHGLLLRYEKVGTGQYGYYEIFPNSLKFVKRTDLPYTLPLDGSVQKGKADGPWFTYRDANYRKGTELPFDFAAYKKGSPPRNEVKSKVIVERYGTSLEQQLNTQPSIPDTFGSSKIAHIVERVQGFAFQANREERIAHAKEQSSLLKRTYPTAPGAKLFTPEAARLVLSLIPFVGALADLAEGKIGDGAKGLLIDVASFVATGGLGGLKGFIKGAKILFKFNGNPFSAAALKGAGTFLRGVLNPVENVPQIISAPLRLLNGVKAIGAGRPVHIGANIYLPVTTFEQWRWTSGAVDAVFLDAGGTPGARKGFSANQAVEAVEKSGLWYRVNPLTGRPGGTPLDQFIPDSI